MRTRHKTGGPLLLLTWTAWVLACGDGPVEPAIEDNPDVRPYVVGAAAEGLGADGRFQIAPDVVPGAESVAVVSASYARQLAAAFTKSYGPAFLGTWEADRGSSIDLAALTVSDRTFPARSTFGAVPQVGCHPSFVRRFGSFYMITLNRGNEPQVRMAVSAQTTEFSVRSTGDLAEPSRKGSDFMHEGIPFNRSGAFFPSPEQAVALAGRATGAKIDQVPEMVLQNIEYSPTFALWRLDLDRDVVVVHPDGRRSSVRVLFVGPSASPRFYVAAAEQPSSVTLSCSRIDENLDDLGPVSITVPVTNAQPLVFEPVTPLR